MFEDAWWDELQQKSHWRLCHEIGYLRDFIREKAPDFYKGYMDSICGNNSSLQKNEEEYNKGYSLGLKLRVLDEVK